MKDNTKAGDGSVPESTYKAEYAEHLWFALVDCLTVDLAHGESTFYRENRINKDVFREMMANQGYDVDRARNAAILLRRSQKKERTKARNEKIKSERLAAREERRRLRDELREKEKDTGWDAGPLPEGMFIQFYPGKNDAAQTYRGISVNFPDGTNLTLQECSAEGLSSLIDIYRKRKEAAACSL